MGQAPGNCSRDEQEEMTQELLNPSRPAGSRVVAACANSDEPPNAAGSAVFAVERNKCREFTLISSVCYLF